MISDTGKDLTIRIAQACGTCKHFSSKISAWDSGRKKIGGYCLILLGDEDRSLDHSQYATHFPGGSFAEKHFRETGVIPSLEMIRGEHKSMPRWFTVREEDYAQIVKIIINREAWLDRQGRRFVKRTTHTCDGWERKGKR